MVWQKKILCLVLFLFKNINNKKMKCSSLKKKMFLLEIFVSFRFQKRLDKTTSAISFSNQKDKSETRYFVFRFEKNENKTTKRCLFHRFKNAAQHCVYRIFFP